MSVIDDLNCLLLGGSPNVRVADSPDTAWRCLEKSQHTKPGHRRGEEQEEEIPYVPFHQPEAEILGHVHDIFSIQYEYNSTS